MDYTVHGIHQARILEWVAFPFPRGSSQPWDQTQVSHIAGGLLTSWATREAQEYFPSPAELPDPRIEPGSPALQADSFQLSYQGSLLEHCLKRRVPLLWPITPQRPHLLKPSDWVSRFQHMNLVIWSRGTKHLDQRTKFISIKFFNSIVILFMRLFHLSLISFFKTKLLALLILPIWYLLPILYFIFIFISTSFYNFQFILKSYYLRWTQH